MSLSRHLEEAGERLRAQRLAGARGSEQEDVALGDLDLLLALLDLVVSGEDAAVVVVDRHAHGALGALLSHDVLGELVVDLVRRGEVLDGEAPLLGLGVLLGLEVDLVDHVGARVHALVADVDAPGPGDELAHLAAGLAAERAAHLRAHGPHAVKLVVACHVAYSWVCSAREVMTLSTRP